MTATSQKTGPKGPRDRPDPGSKMDRLLELVEVVGYDNLDAIRAV